MDWAFYFSFFCAVHLDLIGLLLCMLSGKNKSNFYLGVFVFLFSSIHWQNAILLGGYIDQFRYIDPLCGILLSLCGPFFLFYIRSITAMKVFAFPKDLFHMAPLLVSVIHFIRTLFWTKQEFADFYYATSNKYTLANKIMIFLMIGYFLGYLIWGLVLVWRYNATIRDFASNIDKIRLDWLKHTLYLFLFLSVILSPVLLLIGKIDYMIVAILYFTTFLYFWIVYRSMKHSPVFINEMEAIRSSEILEKVEQPEISRYQNSPLKTDKVQAYFEQLQQYFAEQKPFLDPELSLKGLSDQTGIPPHYVSRVVNEYYQKNFFDLINSFRVEAFKLKLNDLSNQKYSLEGLAFDCGFGSKASFQRAFFKNMNITPSEYRRQILQEQHHN